MTYLAQVKQTPKISLVNQRLKIGDNTMLVLIMPHILAIRLRENAGVLFKAVAMTGTVRAVGNKERVRNTVELFPVVGNYPKTISYIYSQLRAGERIAV